MKIAIVLLCIFSALVESTTVFVGTYQNSPGGIVLYDLQSNSTMKKLKTVATNSPSWLTLHPNGDYLYSSSETTSGKFCAWKLVKDSEGHANDLTALNCVASNGDYPAHLSIHPTGNFLMGTNYNTGNFLVYQLFSNNGTIGKILDEVKPGKGSKGKTPNQNDPHSHMIVASQDGNVVLGVDLGADSVFAWTLNQQTGKLTLVSTTQFKLGSGPRHIACHKSLSACYVLSEYGNTVSMFKFENNQLKSVANYTTLGQTRSDTASAEIRIHPNGKFLYATNRVADDVAIFNISSTTGELTAAGRIGSSGSYPRGMNIDPSGKYMLLANQKGNNVVVLEIGSSGQLTYKGQASEDTPVDILFEASPAATTTDPSNGTPTSDSSDGTPNTDDSNTRNNGLPSVTNNQLTNSASGQKISFFVFMVLALFV